MENLKYIHPELKASYVRLAVYSMVLEALDENGAPESSFYIPLSTLGLNLDQFQIMFNSLKKLKAVKISGHFVTRGKDYEQCVEVFKGIMDRMLKASTKTV